MDEDRKHTLKESSRLISKLHVLSVYFEDEVLLKIYLRIQLIHQIFQSHNELDVSKLDLFHLQYTHSLVDLLKKIKKGNEKKVSLLMLEMQLNKDVITSILQRTHTRKDYDLQKQRQVAKISTSLKKLYTALSEDASTYPFVKGIHSFSARFGKDFFLSCAPDEFSKLIKYSEKDVYIHGSCVIHRKLMGLLCKHSFAIEFIYGITSGDNFLEVYMIRQPKKYFVFLPSRNVFLLCDPSLLDGREFSNTALPENSVIDELNEMNTQLEGKMKFAKNLLPSEIKTLLAETYRKLSDISFLDNITNVDAQANILKSMLNIQTL